MSLPPTSEPFRFLDITGEPLDGPQEWAPALVQLSIPEGSWKDARLWLQDALLPIYARPMGSDVRFLADWPRSGPGHYQLRLDLPDCSEQRVLTIQPKKITQASFSALLDDLESSLPAAVAIALQRAGAFAGVNLLPPQESTLAQQLSKLEWAVKGKGARPGLAKVLSQLAMDHHQILKAYELWAPIEKARRPSPGRLAAALARPGNLGRDNLPNRVVESRVDHTADVYENRLVKVFHDQVRSRLAQLSRLLGAMPNHQPLAVKTHTLLKTLSRSRRQAAFLDGVSTPTHLPLNVTMVLAKRPPYHAALTGYLDFHKNLSAHLESPSLDAPLENLPYLYQLWGTLQVMRVLAEVAAELGYLVKKERLFKRDRSGLFINLLPDGDPVLVLHHPATLTTVRLIPERTYGRGLSFHSISYEQRPDIAVEIERADGSTDILLFDPKYKLLSEDLPPQAQGDLPLQDQEEVSTPITSALVGAPYPARPKKADIDKMHAYRDAIRDNQGNRVVCYAAILYPGPFKGFRHDDIAALPAIPGSEHLLEARLRPLFLSALQP